MEANPTLNETVNQNDSELKNWLVNYVGEKTNPEDGNITVEHIVDVMSKEFPEFLLVIAEENWVRGYQQALNDVELGEQLAKEQTELNKVDTKISE